MTFHLEMLLLALLLNAIAVIVGICRSNKYERSRDQAT